MKIRSILSAVLILSSSCLWAQENQNDESKANKPLSLGVGIDFLPLLSNNPCVLISFDATLQELIGIGVGAGPLFGAEVWSSHIDDASNTAAPHLYMMGQILNSEYIDFEYGYRAYGEAKIYILPGNHKPYFATGYSITESNFSTDYVLRISDGNQRYYRNVSEDYKVKTNMYYAKIGYRFVFAQKRAFLEPSLSYRYVIKEATPEINSYDGEVVTNESLIWNFDDFPAPLGIDFKVGLFLF
ncbi:hypothetical protein [Reichenbachiella ulvae]|uniref:Outer membrane protein beta-barrel domain-containing protein n=1 Tax=Reichenbachiella ulvae TaxID=2980104 RepID=A0ABT3CQN9_9BACT|nr:hypothetical protein [Reichenbachiella ulvae]MCV9385891.1 hypothetical protein [Reichenbachiella ulvae]